ncbi:spermatogenesis-associated protein 31D1, partial [Physeter macrocephalus]|uniref:Spermatogenesis-associated protein 31D1 n=1 Tax=Physeter macrocephalus TaxID=9755 RepID=A0A9W2W7Y3_PHYMC
MSPSPSFFSFCSQHQGRAKGRRKGRTPKGWRACQSEVEEARKVLSLLQSPLGRHDDITRFRQLLCPDPFCEVCNNATAEVNRLLLPEAPEDSTSSVFPLASTAPVTDSSFALSPAFSTVPSRDLTPASLPETSPLSPSALSPNPMTPLVDVFSPSPLGHSLAPEPFPSLDSEFPVDSSPPQPLAFPPLLPHDTQTADPVLPREATLSPDTIFSLDPTQSVADKHDSAVCLPFWSSKDKPKELHVPQQPPYPKTLEDHLQQKPIQFFWGLPSLHSESLPSAVHVLADSSSIFIFNRNSNASTGQESPVLPDPLPLALPEIQPGPLPQSQPLPLTQVQSQADPQSPLPVIPSEPLPQIRICGVSFHRPQDESESLSSSEIQQLEWNIVQKQQGSVWGLPSVVQRSREDFCPSAPNVPCHRAPQAHVSISILPGEFPLSDELRKKLEHHLRKRLIQRRWGLPRRIYESVSLMLPPNRFSEASESESNNGVSPIPVSKGQSSKNVDVGLSQTGSFHERSSEMFQLEEDVGKDLGHSLENGPKDHLLNDPKSSSGKDLGYDSEKDLSSSQTVSLSEKNSRVSAESLGRRQPENVLKVHLSKKLEEINEGRLPGTVHNSWHAIRQTLLLSVKSHTQTKLRSLPSSVGEAYSLNTFQDLTFVDSSAQQMLEAHIKRFRMRMLWALPRRVLESIRISKLKDASFQSLSHANLPSSTSVISEADSKSGSFKSFRGSSKSLHGDKVGTTTTPALDRSLPATSPVGKGGQRVLRQSRSDVNRGLAEDVQRIKDARQTRLPVSLCVTGKAGPRQTQLANRYPQKLLAKQAGARYEPKHKTVSFSDKGEMQQGKKVEESEPVSMPKWSREVFTAEELDTLQLKTSDMLTTRKPGSSQMTNVKEHKEETTVTPGSPPPKFPVPQDPKSLDLKEQLFSELNFKLENREHSQAQGQPTDTSLASDNLTYEASLTHAQVVSGGDMGASQVLHVHLKDRGIRMEQQQEPRVPKHALRRCQDKNFPPTAKRVSPLEPKAEELGGGDPRLGTSQLRRKSFPTQEMVLKETLASKSSQTLSEKGQPLPEGRVRKRMKDFLQWFFSGKKYKRLEDAQEKRSPISTVQNRGLVKSRAALTGTTGAQKIVTDIGKSLEEKLGCQHVIDATCSQEPLPSPVQFRKTQQKAEVQV